MKTRPLFAASVLLAALNSAGAQTGGAAPAKPASLLPDVPNIAYDKYTLPNGLQVILVEDKRLPVVAVNVWYHVGPANEAPGLAGFAHLFEHMMFAGSKHLPRGLADRLLEGAGASDSNGGTGYDSTSYYDTVPANQLELALWVHADRMGYLLDVLDQKSLTNQQDVVRNERRETVENEPYGIVEEALNHALFPPEHPYYASVIGSHTDIQNAKLADVRDFFTRYYGPNNASIVIAGDIDKVKARALVAKYFGSLKPGPEVVRPQVVTPPITEERRIVVPDRVELPRVYMGWLTPPAYQPDDAELAVAAQILAGGKSSRLYQSLVYERQIAQDVDADQDARALASTFLIEVTARAGHTPQELESAIDAELAALRAHGPTVQEVERAKRQIETAMLTGLEQLGGDGLADQLNHYNQFTGDPGYLAQDIAALRRITAADVQRAVKTWLQSQHRVIVAGVPGEPKLPHDPPVPKALRSPKVKEAGVNAAEAWRAKAPQAGPPPAFKLPLGEAFTLKNGLTVIHHRNPALPLVSAEIVIRSGADSNPLALPGLAGFTAQMLTEGTEGRSALQIAEEIAQLGAFMDADSGTNASAVSLLALRATFEQAFAVMADVVLRPAFPALEVERQRASRLGDLLGQRDEAEAVASVAAAGALFGPRHAYGYGQLGTEPAIHAVTRADVQDFWRRHYVPSNAALVVTGDIGRDALQALAEQHFGAWQGDDAPAFAPGTPASTRARVVVVDKPGAPQTALRLVAFGAERTSAAYPALEVMNAAFGGLFTSRINQKLREEKGYSYGVFSGFRYGRTPGPFSIAGSVRADATGASVAELLREAQAMIDQPLGEDELAGARNAQLLSLPNGFETNADIGASLAEAFVFGLPLDYYRQLPAKLAAVTAQDVQAAARRYLEPSRLIIVAVGDRKRIVAQLAKLKLGPVEIRDSEGQLLP